MNVTDFLFAANSTESVAALTALTVNRVALGAFFAFSGFHKLFNRDRHAGLVETLEGDHIPFVKFNSWFVPSVEFTAGLGLIVGLLSPLAALGLIAILAVALCTDGIPKRIPEYHPIDKADWCDDLLYLPETLYIVMLVIVIAVGSGYGLDIVAAKFFS